MTNIAISPYTQSRTSSVNGTVYTLGRLRLTLLFLGGIAPVRAVLYSLEPPTNAYNWTETPVLLVGSLFKVAIGAGINEHLNEMRAQIQYEFPEYLEDFLKLRSFILLHNMLSS